MKKIISMLLVLCTCAAILASCGEGETEDTTTTTKATTTTTTTTTTTKEEDGEPVTPPDTTPATKPDVTNAVHINAIEGVDARFYAFEKPSEFGGPVGLIYYFEDKTTELHNDAAQIIADGGYAEIWLNGKQFKIEQYANGAPWFRFNVESVGAVIYSGVSYEAEIFICDAEGACKYYTSPQSQVSGMSSANLPERAGLNIELPAGVVAQAVESASVIGSGANFWGDGKPENLFDGDTAATKLGGNPQGTVTVEFALVNGPAEIKYYSLYTGGDTAKYPERNPTSWVLYGKVGEEYVVLSTVTSTETNVPGLGAADSTPFSYEVTNVQSCSQFKIEFVGGGAIQLNEMVLYTAAE